MKTSKFKLADKLGYTSPFEDSPFRKDWQGKREEEKHNQNNTGDITDFLPIVNINFTYSPLNCLISKKNCNENGENIFLDSNFDQNKRKYWVHEVVISKSSDCYIPLINKLGYFSGALAVDGDGVLIFSPNKQVSLKLYDEKDSSKVSDGSKLYNLNTAKIDDEYVLAISHNLDWGTKFKIEIYAQDDTDDMIVSKKRVKCGELNVKVIEKGTFMTDEAQRGVSEISYIASETSPAPTSGEYSVSYCMQAADRFLGKVVLDENIFYTYDDIDDKRIYVPSFDTAKARIATLKKLGYMYLIAEFKGETIYKIKDLNEKDRFGNNPTKSLSNISQTVLYQYINPQVCDKMGYHIYYLSLVDSLHTMILYIDASNLCDIKYEMHDQHGKSSSFGKLIEIDEGFRKQSEWLFRWTKANPKLGYWAALNIVIAKFQRK